MRNNDALASAEAIRLDNDRRLKFIDKSISIFQGVCFDIAGSRNIVTCQEILHKDLGAFELRCLSRRPENCQTSLLEQIHNSINQRCLGSHNRQINTIHFDKVSQFGKITDSDILAQLIGSTISGRKVQLIYTLVSFKCQADRILTTPTSNDQYIHDFLRKISNDKLTNALKKTPLFNFSLPIKPG